MVRVLGSIDVTRVRFPDPVSYVGSEFVVSSRLTPTVFFEFSGFSSSKN